MTKIVREKVNEDFEHKLNLSRICDIVSKSGAGQWEIVGYTHLECFIKLIWDDAIQIVKLTTGDKTEYSDHVKFSDWNDHRKSFTHTLPVKRNEEAANFSKKVDELENMFKKYTRDDKKVDEADKETMKKIKKKTGGIIPSIPLGP